MNGIYWWTGAIVFWLVAIVGAVVIGWLVLEQAIEGLRWWVGSRNPHWRVLFTAWLIRHGWHRKTREQAIGTMKWLLEELEKPEAVESSNESA